MKPSLHFVRLSSIPILQQLQWEEALLRADHHNWCLFNYGTAPAIVLGISGKIEQLIHQKKWTEAPIPLIRRFSGGGTVIVDENTLFVTLICQANALPIQPFPRPLMQWTANNLYHPLFSSPLFELRENDYTLEGKKWGGNAQSIIKGRWLHHSSLLWDYHKDYMDYLLFPPKTPAYRQGRSHNDFLCRLRDYFPCVKSFQDQLIQQLGEYFILIEKERKELECVASQPHRQVTCLLDNLEIKHC